MGLTHGSFAVSWPIRLLSLFSTVPLSRPLRIIGWDAPVKALFRRHGFCAYQARDVIDTFLGGGDLDFIMCPNWVSDLRFVETFLDSFTYLWNSSLGDTHEVPKNFDIRGWNYAQTASPTT